MIQAKRSRSELDDGVNMDIQTDYVISDTLKRICISPSRSFSDESMESNKGIIYNRKEDRKDDSNAKVQHQCANPLRRPRSQIDESIENVIRKHRRRYEIHPSMNEYMDLQIVPIGPDPLQDQRLLGTLISSSDVLKAQSMKSNSDRASTPWPSEIRHPNVYNYENDSLKAIKKKGVFQSSHGGADARDGNEMEVISAPGSVHHANDITHSDWFVLETIPEAQYQVESTSSSDESISMVMSES